MVETPRARWVPGAVAALVLAVGLGLFLLASRVTAPASDELGTISAIERATGIVTKVAARGPAVLTLPEIRVELESGVHAWVLLGAWCKLSIGRMGLVDPLSAMRLPWLALGALAALGVFGMLRRAHGTLVGALGAAWLMALPPFVHGIVVMREGALVAAFHVLVLACQVQSLGGGRRALGWAGLGALALGAGSAVSLATLSVIPVLLAHFWLSRGRTTLRLARRGRLPVPPLVLFGLALGPIAYLALSPALWKATPAVVARVVLAPLGPTVTPAPFAGTVVHKLPVPGGYWASWLVQSLPVAALVAALLGVGAAVHHGLARRFASGRLRPPRDRHALGLLGALGLFGLPLAAALQPSVLVRFPPRVELALPYVALLAASGLCELATRFARPALGRATAIATVLVAMIPAHVKPATASLAFSPLTGGPARIQRTRALPFGDGSEVGALVPAIDALGQSELSLDLPPELSPELFRVLASAGRMKTRIVPRHGSATHAIERGASARGSLLGEARRDGAVAFTLIANRPR
jgi:hypothetical protein